MFEKVEERHAKIVERRILAPPTLLKVAAGFPVEAD